jgi:hypothetical protein
MICFAIAAADRFSSTAIEVLLCGPAVAIYHGPDDGNTGIRIGGV